MAEPFVGAITIFAGNFAPSGWAFCDGRLINISDNTALYSLLGTTYGGDGVNTFALPDLRGRFPIHQGQGLGLSPYVIGETTGQSEVTLATSQIPSHGHALYATGANATTNSASGNLLAKPVQPGSSANVSAFATAGAAVQMNGNAITPAGGSQPHDNMPPYLALNYIIALFGVYPSRN
ncbi:MAG TPA: tail fiber protein [Holophagaceae bacterium]|jgi:microcystin-dependent protein|nr:tail fiber protein [Holophagaceae bacterium]